MWLKRRPPWVARRACKDALFRATCHSLLRNNGARCGKKDTRRIQGKSPFEAAAASCPGKRRVKWISVAFASQRKARRAIAGPLDSAAAAGKNAGVVADVSHLDTAAGRDAAALLGAGSLFGFPAGNNGVGLPTATAQPGRVGYSASADEGTGRRHRDAAETSSTFMIFRTKRRRRIPSRQPKLGHPR